MNIYEKLQTIRCELQRMNLKKSGNNKYAGYLYYELADFLPQINELMLKHGLTSQVNFLSNCAELLIIDVADPVEGRGIIRFESPLSEANLKGCHAVQNLGAVQTYIRRYLYTNAFEIVEHDALDGSLGKPEDKNKEKGDTKETTSKELTTAEKAWNMLLELASMSAPKEQINEKALELLELHSTWQDKDGKEVKGKRTFKGMSDKAIQATYGRIKKEYEIYKKEGKDE